MNFMETMGNRKEIISFILQHARLVVRSVDRYNLKSRAHGECKRFTSQKARNVVRSA